MGLFNKKHSKTFPKEMDKQINRKIARKKNIIKLTSCRTTYIWILWAFVGNLLRRKKDVLYLTLVHFWSSGCVTKSRKEKMPERLKNSYFFSDEKF